jgi:hypothetical protein
MRMIRPSWLILAVALVSAIVCRGDGPPTAKTQYADLADAMRRAREGNDWQTYLAKAGELQQLLNGSPNSWLNLARGYIHARAPEKALAAVEHFVAMGQSADLLLTSAEFAPLRESPKFSSIREHMAANGAPVSRAAAAFDIGEPGFVAEDIDYDSRSRRFFVSSIKKKKVVVLDAKGRATDFAAAPDAWPMMAIKVDARRRLLWVTEVALDGFVTVPKADWGKSAVLCYDLDHGKLLKRIDGPQGSALGDMVLLDNGDPLLSDGAGGGVYRLRRTEWKLERVDDGSFLSPQTPALHPDGKHVFVPDYLRGIGILDLVSKQVRWIPMESKYALNGTDGLYFDRGNLVLVQNGTSPERVVTLGLDPALGGAISIREIERATSTLGDPTHGVVVDHDFYYIANSGWDTLNDDGSAKSDAKLTPVHIMRARLD